MDTVSTYGTAQRQLDTCMCATAWNFSCEDYIMRSIFERVPITFVPASGILFGVCTCECSTLMLIVYSYMMNLRILSLYVPIDPWIDCPTEKLITCSCVQYLISYCLVCYRLVHVENRSFIGDWISINFFIFGLSVGWKPVRKYASY